jgi:isopentenyl-diphosphate delta-isomerase
LNEQSGEHDALRHALVSSDLEPLILVDASDREIGFMSKARCHEGRGVLHRAFSLFIFNSEGQLLMQQRSAAKRLWPGYWSNSCCSHPRRGESLQFAAHRRLWQELGMRCALSPLFKFRYQAQFDATGAENEMCSVYIGCSDEPVCANVHEIADWCWIDPAQLQAELQRGARRFTPWFRIEWTRIWTQLRSALPRAQQASGAWVSR